MSINFGVCFLD